MGEMIKVAAKKPEAKRENKAPQKQEIGPSQSISSPVEQILFLQRTIGNQAVGRLIESRALQAKLGIDNRKGVSDLEAGKFTHTLQQEERPLTKGRSEFATMAPASIIKAEKTAEVLPKVSSEIVPERRVESTVIAGHGSATGTSKPSERLTETQSPLTSADKIPTEKKVPEKRVSKTSETGAAPEVIAAGPPGTVGPEPKPGASPEPGIDTSSSEGLLRSLAAVPASSFGHAIKKATAETPLIQKKEKSDLEASFLEVERPTGLPRLTEKGEAKPTVLETGHAPEAERTTGREGEPPETRHEEALGPIPGSKVSTAAIEPKEEEGENWWNWLVNRVRKFLDSIPTTDPGLSTSAGPRPQVDLTGEADPTQNDRQQQVSDQEIVDSQAQANSATTADFGENEIYPTAPKEMLRPSYKPTSPPSAAGKIDAPHLKLPEEARIAIDKNAAPWLADKVNEQQEYYRLEQVEYETKSQETREEGQRRIAEETERVRAEQEGLQEQARSDVNDERQKWREENSKIQEEYSTKSEAKRQEIDQQIQGKVQTTEQEANRQLTDAERQAEDKRLEAEAKAAEEKRKAENKPRSTWEKIKGAVSDFFEDLKKVVNDIFDGLRKVVKVIIEGAKAAVRGLIEAARIVVVGLIKTFGEALKGFVTIALAAFPKIAAKARAWIDRRVDDAVDAVNKAAEALKKVTDKILDWVGKALDTALSLLQKAYNFALDVLKFLAVGLIEIMEKIGNLVEAAKQMPDHFWGQVSEELFGMNLAEPLPIERTRAPKLEETAAAAMGTGALPSGDIELLNRPRLGENDITVDNVEKIELDPEFVAKLNLQEGEELEFGESADTSRSIEAIKAEMLGTSPTTQVPSVASEEGAKAAPVKTPEETAEEELQALMAQEPTGGCTKEKRGEPAKESEVPEHMKIGPLTLGQRSRYLLHQMKIGIKQWFECNWPWLLAGAVAALLGVILLTILTGGAFLAALPIIMELIAAIMIGVAIVRVTSYVGDYLSQGWAGNIVSAAKSLARGLAIGAIELIFALLFNLGAVIKSLKAGLKATAKAAATAAKATVKTAIKNVKELGRLGLQAGKAVVKNGKFIMKGLKSGFAKGAKSLDDLAKRLWQQVRFRKFKIRLKRPWIELLGYINPWVLIAKSELVFVEKKDLPAGKKVGDIVEVTVSGKKLKGELVGMGAKPRYQRIADLVQGAGTTDSNVIHHLIEQQILKMDDYVKFTIEEINAPSRLIPILKGSVNEVVHLSRIRIMWNSFYVMMKTPPIDLVKNRTAIMKFADFTKEFIEEMGRFMKSSTKYKDAAKKGNEDLIKQILHEQAENLLKSGGKFDLDVALENAWRS